MRTYFITWVIGLIHIFKFDSLLKSAKWKKKIILSWIWGIEDLEDFERNGNVIDDLNKGILWILDIESLIGWIWDSFKVLTIVNVEVLSQH